MIWKLEIKGSPNYGVRNNRIYNKKRPNIELRPKIYNGIEFYNLNSKKVRKDKLEYQRPKDFDCPF